MKYVVITGGLGNQMFIYAFMLNLRKMGYVSMPILLRTGKKYGYHKYELPIVFELVDNDEREPVKSKLFRIGWRLLRFIHPSARARVLGFRSVSVPLNFVYYSNLDINRSRNELFKGTWQSEKYFIEAKETILRAFTFRSDLISARTFAVKKLIDDTTSVSIHIRRDDYLSCDYRNGFGGICTLEYYHRAIMYISQRCEKITFFIFSDDPQWARENMTIENCIVVDHNKGSNSWQDMYLMHCCKHNIIANSTFSWWGAYLNPNREKIVIAPRVWWNGIDDDVVPSGWIRL